MLKILNLIVEGTSSPVSSVRDGERQCQRAARVEQGRAGGGAVRTSRLGRAGDGAACGGEAGEGWRRCVSAGWVGMWCWRGQGREQRR